MKERTEKKNIVLGITGSIAAYKMVEVARNLVTRGFEVRVIMSEGAQKFITPLTFQAVTGNPVVTSFWEEEEAMGIGHIHLADWAECMVVSPATADSIAKLAAGFSDSPLLAAVLATKAPVLVAPAMNVNMYTNQITQNNIELLKSRGFYFVGPDEGALACGWNGSGRLAEPIEIVRHIDRTISIQDFKGKKVIVTAGPTREHIDAVRYITNRSSGKMGVALAQEAFRRGAEVTLIHGHIPVNVSPDIKCYEVTSAKEMQEKLIELSFEKNSTDYIVMAAAVADARPKESADKKLKKGEIPSSIPLEMNADILSEVSKKRGADTSPRLIAFAVETGEIEDLLMEANRKLKEKGADMIVGNFAQDALELDTNRVWIVDRHGKQSEVATASKYTIAKKILDMASKL